MPQRPKAEVREAILQAAAETFAEAGFAQAGLGEIVERAGTSIGNFYKYFGNKDALFADFIPSRFTADLKRRVRAQVEALRTEPDVFSLDASHPYRRASEDLLAFTIAHRERVVFLLLRAEGTRYEGFARSVVRLLARLAVEHARATYPRFAITPAKKRAIDRVYRAFVATLGTILAEEQSEQAVRQAIALQTTYHLSGLRAVFIGSQPGEITRERSR